jgi:hypothetical protein
MTWKRDKKANAESSRRYRRAHPERIKIALEKYRKLHPELVRSIVRRSHWKTVGIDLELAEEVWKRARCDICGRKDGLMTVDHDHKTMKIRGLLCNNHNRALGLCHDSPTELLALVKYLETAEHL